MIGIKDVAKAAGVSITTVSNVLNGKQNVGEATRRKVLEVCEELDYVPNGAGKALKGGTSNTILFNFSDFDRDFYLRIINGISDYARDNGYDLIICTDRSCEKYMRNNLTCGAITLDKQMKTETLMRVANEHYPVIVLDRMTEHPFIKSVIVENYEPMFELVEGLVKNNYKRFAFLGGPEYTADNRERYEAFLDVLDKYKLQFQQKNYFTGDYREKSGYAAAKIIMLSNELPDALVCANDNMAIGAIKAFRENGINVPEDIAVTGFDDCALAKVMGLTTVSIPNYERGYIAARFLIENIRGKRDNEPFRISAHVKWRQTNRMRK